MRVLFACGGTGGHINPAIASAKTLKERRPEAEILFAGAEGGMETRLVPDAGFPIKTVPVEGFHRALKLSSVSGNLRAFRKLIYALRWADELVREFAPDVVMGTGGYACYPILRAASKAKIPTLIHESNAYPGLATRMLSKRLSRVMVNFPESERYLKRKDNITVVGTPIREDMIFQDRAVARRELGLGELPLLVSFWGSQGAREMNKMMAEFVAMESKGECRFQHIHACGKYGYRWMPQMLEGMGVTGENTPNFELREYIYDMARVMAAADLVMCRGGASTLSELMALAKPAIIVPSPNVADNHQEKNARVLGDVGGAVVITERECSGKRLYEEACSLLNDAEKRAAMSSALGKIAVLDATDRIYQEITSLAKPNVF
ncbi:MAG: UDP-N-acetylglucosamine--N-acetylmuramyl-(pentapeptide) pyrophosphoryl-undecaprenol N-acetylglucosamine transferase [Oscillospiraceae bacterium]|nr:UDP-N-acetylglucosamine--N-acetylmuramyl-(pentapeptide) pyrophosphoryl-undecaprenol N-acetylglucosamine transferase [Oscillospiraceae bacterium]